MFGMASPVSLTLFMSYPTDRWSGKLASTALCSCFAANHENESCFGGMNTPSIGRSTCTIIYGTIHHFIRLQKQYRTRKSG